MHGRFLWYPQLVDLQFISLGQIRFLLPDLLSYCNSCIHCPALFLCQTFVSALCPLERLSLTAFPDNSHAEETSLFGKGLMIRSGPKLTAHVAFRVVPVLSWGGHDMELILSTDMKHFWTWVYGKTLISLLYGRGTCCSVQSGRKAKREEFNLRPLEQLLAKPPLFLLKLLMRLVLGKTDHLRQTQKTCGHHLAVERE